MCYALDVKDRGVLTAYFDAAMARARVKQVDEGQYVGRIPGCIGLLGYGASPEETLEDLRVALEDWVLIGLRVGDSIPPMAGINLNSERTLEPVDAL